jgi:putative glutamine amidotransferase
MSSVSDHPVIAVAWPKPDYLQSLERAGGSPRVLRPEIDRIPDALDGCGGLLLTGGADVDPVRYGDADRHDTVEIDAERDEYEFALARYALDHDVPLLAICRGVQLLNVVAGGTLVQDIPSGLTTTVLHRQAETPAVSSTHAHDIDILPNTRLHGLLDGAARPQIPVNSRHHQSVRSLAPGFVVSATAPDGVIEAIEKPSADFCIGVQWHPENYWQTGEFSQLFEGLVAAASRRTARQNRR